jgi:hypothetical protein
VREQRVQSRGRRTTRRRLTRLLAGTTIGSVFWGSAVLAGPEPQTLIGVPQQIIPEAREVGLPPFTMPMGTVSLGGSVVGTTSMGGAGTTTDSSALDTMLGTSWGASAEQSAEELGVNPSAVAATCEIESGCQNVAGTGSIAGAFQMSAETYESSIAAALAQDPSLASNIVPGLAGQSDPATEAIAAAEYLKEGAEYLESEGMSDPTALQVRGYYNFGPANGAQLAAADDSQLMSSAMPSVSSATLAANGITSTETVGQWRAAVAAKMGMAANQGVLS